MEIGDPATVMRIPITTGKRTTTLELASRDECRDLIRAIALASAGLPADDQAALILADDQAPIVISGSHGRDGKLDSLELADRLTAYSWSGLKSLLHFINGYCPAVVRSALESEPFAPPAPADDNEAWTLTPAGAAAIDQAPAPNPPHSVLENDEQVCHAQDEGYLCLAQEGHDGPDHIAYDGTDGPWHRWPVTGLCDSELPLKHGGALKCTLDAGHYGTHSAVAGDYRWLGHGADARDEEGNRIAPLAVGGTHAPVTPVTYLACGDQLTDPASSLLAVGAVSLCLLHGVTEVISAEEAATLAAPGPYDQAIQQAEYFAQPGNTVADLLAEQAATR